MQMTLKYGVMFGEEPQTDLETRDLTTADLIEAECAAERLMTDAFGNPILVVSQTLFNYELLRRQIKSIGKIQGPISIKMLGTLHTEDLALINNVLQATEVAKSKQVLEQRGRVEATD